MNTSRALACLVVVSAALLAAPPPEGRAESVAPKAGRELRDGQHDFDGEIGRWKTQARVLKGPLSGSTTWIEMSGVSTVTKVFNGKANMVELIADRPGGHFEGASWRLYNPESRQWSINFANAADGLLTTPQFGEFKDGRGEFFGQDTLRGKPIYVKFVIVPETADRWRFEQSFSGDGGKTWELNWVAVDTRLKEG
jgi:hypothetical protein